MRGEKKEKILLLLEKMLLSYQGLTLDDIQKIIGTDSRRTAERKRDILIRAFPQIEAETDFITKKKRWGFTVKKQFSRSFDLDSKDLSALDIAIKKLSKENLDTQSERLAKIRFLLTEQLENSKKNRIESNTEGRLLLHNFAYRPSPKVSVPTEILQRIEEAMFEQKVIDFNYNEDQFTGIQPYGIIYGTHSYLVGRDQKKRYRYYALRKISNIEKKSFFMRDSKFDLKKYSEKSFGTYQEKPLKVELLFQKKVAEAVKEFSFHPTQKIKENKDGNITVKFSAGGAWEIIWHVFTWGDAVKIISPKSLKKEYKNWLEKALKTLL